jgi:hypothetical protein
MKVRIKVSIAGLAEPLYGLEAFSFAPGHVVDLDTTLAGHWIASGTAIAEPALASDMTFADLSGKTKAQLVAFAKEQLLLDLDPSTRKDEILNQIAEALPKE